jgi:hypothetical protein
MHRLAGLLGALALTFLLLVPAAAAAEPFGDDEHVIFTTGGDVTLAANEHADVLVVVDGAATIEGNVGAVLVINGTANLVGAHTTGIVAISSHVTIDAGSEVSGDIRTLSSTVDAASGSIMTGTVRDLAPDLASATVLAGPALFLVYLAFVLSAIAAGLLMAGLAARQVGAAGQLISREPLMTIASGFIGLLGIVVIGTGAIVTVFGAPFGLGLLVFVLPGLFFIGYLVAGIWVGEQILGRSSPEVMRERPYLAALVGLAVVGAISIVPGVGGIVGFVGFGAVMLLMWRVARGGRGTVGGVLPVSARATA